MRFRGKQHFYTSDLYTIYLPLYTFNPLNQIPLSHKIFSSLFPQPMQIYGRDGLPFLQPT